jgi:hypothetical protein
VVTQRDPGEHFRPSHHCPGGIRNLTVAAKQASRGLSLARRPGSTFSQALTEPEDNSVPPVGTETPQASVTGRTTPIQSDVRIAWHY